MVHINYLKLPTHFLLNKCAYLFLFNTYVKYCQIKWFFPDLKNLIRNINWKVLDSGSSDSDFIFKEKIHYDLTQVFIWITFKGDHKYLSICHQQFGKIY